LGVLAAKYPPPSHETPDVILSLPSVNCSIAPLAKPLTERSRAEIFCAKHAGGIEQTQLLWLPASDRKALSMVRMSMKSSTKVRS
jgi:hypothetical protein